MLRASLSAAVLMAVFSPILLAQSSASPPNPDVTRAPAPPAADPQGTSQAPRKVWTNENLAGAGGTVSVVGNKGNQKYGLHPDKPADPATVSRIRENLTKLQTQLEAVDQQLAAFKEFEQGETVKKASTEIPNGYVRVPVNQQIPVLKEKKKKLQGQIDDLLDEARKKGIEPGQLR